MKQTVCTAIMTIFFAALVAPSVHGMEGHHHKMAPNNTHQATSPPARPAPVFSTTDIFQTSFATGDNPQVVFAGDKMFYFGGLKEVAMGFAKKTGIHVALNGFGCRDGALNLIAGKAGLAGQCRLQSAPFEKKENLVRHPVARYGLAAFVHPSNPVQNLSLKQLDRINRGEVTNWKEVGGNNAPIIVVEPVHCYCHHPEKGKNQKGPEILRSPKGKFIGNRIKAYSQFVVMDLVGTLQNAIGTEKSPYVDTGKVKLLAINGVAMNAKTVANGSYPVARTLALVTRPDTDPATMRFVRYAQGPEGQQIIAATRLYPF